MFSASVDPPFCLLIYDPYKPAAQVFLRMRQNNGLFVNRVLEHMVRARNAFKQPTFLLQPSFYVAAVVQHGRYDTARITLPTFSKISPIWFSLTISGGVTAIESPTMRNMMPSSWKPRSIAS